MRDCVTSNLLGARREWSLKIETKWQPICIWKIHTHIIVWQRFIFWFILITVPVVRSVSINDMLSISVKSNSFWIWTHFNFLVRLYWEGNIYFKVLQFLYCIRNLYQNILYDYMLLFMITWYDACNNTFPQSMYERCWLHRGFSPQLRWALLHLSTYIWAIKGLVLHLVNPNGHTINSVI